MLYIVRVTRDGTILQAAPSTWKVLLDVVANAPRPDEQLVGLLTGASEGDTHQRIEVTPKQAEYIGKVARRLRLS